MGDEAVAVARLELPVAIASVPVAHAAIAEALAPHAPSARLRQAVDLVVEETIMNLQMHAFDGSAAGQTLQIDVAVSPRRVHLCFRDRGRPFDPLAHAPAALPRTLDEAAVGGLGWRLVRAAAAHLGYRRDGDCNALTVEIERADPIRPTGR